jgi:hypothetical protein
MFLVQSEEEFRKQYDYLLDAYRNNLKEARTSEAFKNEENRWLYTYIENIILSNSIPTYAQGLNWDSIITADLLI